ncbi:MAG: RNA 2',3'-cyclic phosphodiesterase [Dehalococcoidia bacterium]|nr:MAG: RNA 2',3'-cyclic phosphodiesterase [Dehalococcoidia bacterium]
MEKIRAFIAIELPDPVKDSLSSLEDRLRPAEHPYVKWVDPQGIHLTLKFLGNIAPDQVPRIIEAITLASQGTSPLKLQIGGLGAFPNLQRPRVIWVAVTGEVDPLIALQRGMDQALVPLGFAIERRPFSPHLTLGRLRERASLVERNSIGKLVMATKSEGSPAQEVKQISLMRSTLTPSGAIYSRLASIELKGG